MDKRFFDIRNPWRFGLKLPSPLIRRDILDHLSQWLSTDEVMVIYGPRRVGKSTLFQSIIDELIRRQSVTPDSIYLFDLDTLDCSDVLASPSALIDFIGVPDQRVFVFIDEIQRMQNPGLFLKGVFDLGLPIKLFVSGSSSLGIRMKVRESLSGRKRVVRLGGLSWTEFMRAPITGKDERTWQNYLTYGAYPAVVLAPNVAEKRRLLLEYLESYLDRDIDSFLRVDRMDLFREFLQLLSFQSGSLVNLNEFASTMQVSRDTLRRYLSYLEETFLVRRLLPFARNPRKEISKMPKVYFTDFGWCNLLGAGFGDWDTRTDRGGLLETAVEHWLRDSFPLAQIRFWRTQAKAEVDFVVDDGGSLHAFEVKAKNLNKPGIGRGLRSFINKYQPESATVINLSLESQVKVQDMQVEFVTFPKCMEN